MQLTSDATASGDKPRRLTVERRSGTVTGLTVARRGATVTGACGLSGAWKAAAAATARASMLPSSLRTSLPKVLRGGPRAQPAKTVMNYTSMLNLYRELCCFPKI